MKKFVLAAAAVVALPLAGAHAQSMNSSPNGSMSKQNAPGTTGAMSNATSNGVATDPEAVAAQQKGSAKASPGTVGAAPGGDTPSQKANSSERK